MSDAYKLFLQKAGILAAVYLFLRFLLPFIFPFFLAWLTVSFLNNVRNEIRIRLLPFSAGWLFLLALAACVLLGLAAWLLYLPCKELFFSYETTLDSFLQQVDWLLASLSDRLVILVPSLFSCLFQIFLYFISVILFAQDWIPFQKLLSSLPFSIPVSHAGKRVGLALKNWFHAQLRIMLAVSLECTAGFWLLKIPGSGLWAVLTGFLDALPIFGTGTVFLPWILLTLLQGNRQRALWLALLYILTWLTREILEPRLIGNGMGLLPICFLISVILGLRLLGPTGLLTGPFGVLFVKELWAEVQMTVPPETPSASSSEDE